MRGSRRTAWNLGPAGCVLLCASRPRLTSCRYRSLPRVQGKCLGCRSFVFRHCECLSESMPSWLFEHGHSSSASTQVAAMTPSTLPVVDFVDDKHIHHPATPPNNSKIQLPPPVLQKPRSYLSRTNYGYLRALKSFWARTRGPSNPQYPPSMVASVNDSLQESQFEPFQLDSDGGNQEVDEIVVDQPWSDTYEPIVSLPKDTTGDVAEPIVTKRRPTSLLGRTLRWMMERYRDFFSSRFDDVEMERRFSEENWDSQRVSRDRSRYA